MWNRDSHANRKRVSTSACFVTVPAFDLHKNLSSSPQLVGRVTELVSVTETKDRFFYIGFEVTKIFDLEMVADFSYHTKIYNQNQNTFRNLFMFPAKK